MAKAKSEILQGTLDLMVLKTLGAMGAMHWLRHRATHRADQRGRATSEPGHHLSLIDPARGEGLAPRCVGRHTLTVVAIGTLLRGVNRGLCASCAASDSRRSGRGASWRVTACQISITEGFH